MFGLVPDAFQTLPLKPYTDITRSVTKNSWCRYTCPRVQTSDVFAFSPHSAYCISGPIYIREIRAESAVRMHVCHLVVYASILGV